MLRTGRRCSWLPRLVCRLQLVTIHRATIGTAAGKR